MKEFIDEINRLLKLEETMTIFGTQGTRDHIKNVNQTPQRET